MLSAFEITVRLTASLATGVLIGINRRMHIKPVGVRTLGLVCLGSAMVTLEGSNFNEGVDANASRVIQGLITGIGFLGAGVIVKGERQSIVHGMTTAAAIWVTSGLGIACGLGAYVPVVIGFMLMLVLLSFGGTLDRAVFGLSKKKKKDHVKHGGRSATGPGIDVSENGVRPPATAGPKSDVTTGDPADGN